MKFIINFPPLQELELLPPKDLHQNVYIKHPVSIEQYLMEGSYNKVSFNIWLVYLPEYIHNLVLG